MAFHTTASENRCGIVLAAGNGERLRDFVYQKRGDYLPKQYNNFIGKRSLLEHTFARVERLLAARRLFAVIAREHLEFKEVRRQIGARPPGTLVIQPRNKDTAPGILLPLLHAHKRYPDAVVGVFPSDHFVRQEDQFMRYVERAFRIVERDGCRIVILGMDPGDPDPEYGYIVPGELFDNGQSDSVKPVTMFAEKPSLDTAQKIIRAGALWNTLVFVATVKTLLAVFQRRTPELYGAFQPIAAAIGTPREASVTEQVYRGLPPINFSKGVLEILPYDHHRNFLVLPVRGVTWNDWGNAARVLTTLRQLSKSRQAGRGYSSPNEMTFAVPSNETRLGVTKRQG
jgi:mannose-1-phosphate guanylyltransferase